MQRSRKWSLLVAVGRGGGLTGWPFESSTESGCTCSGRRFTPISGKLGDDFLFLQTDASRWFWCGRHVCRSCGMRRWTKGGRRGFKVWRIAHGFCRLKRRRKSYLFIPLAYIRALTKQFVFIHNGTNLNGLTWYSLTRNYYVNVGCVSAGTAVTKCYFLSM